MKKNILYILSAIATLFITSCEKVIDIDVNDADQQLVVEGILNDDGSPAKVYITRTVGLNATNNFPTVDNADVKLTDDAGNTYAFTLVKPGVYLSDSITTAALRKYTLIINVESKTYTAQSQMPSFVSYDSLGIDSLGFFGNASYQLIPYHPDPVNVKNFYRYKIYVNGEADKAIYADNDDFTDGRYASRPYFSDLEMEPGDTLKMEMYNIDESTYIYFFSLSQSQAGQDQSATPANPISNFSGGCLGYFSAQTMRSKSVIVP